MTKLVVYFHGYGSSSKTDKVQRLRDQLPDCEVVAFDIDVDPEISIPYLLNKIDSVLLDNINDPDEVIFVGTSLGAWYASVLAGVYSFPSVLINPCYDPRVMLEKYGVPNDVLEKYSPMKFRPNAKYFIGVNDEVIDYSPIWSELERCDSIFVSGDHRFNGPEFDKVSDYINQI